MGEVHAQEGVARRHGRQHDRAVSLCPGVGLHVDVFGAVERLGAFDRQLLGNVDVLATPVVAAAGVAFGVFVGQDRTLCLKHGTGDDVFRRNQLDLGLLTRHLLRKGCGQRRIGVADAGRPEIGKGGGVGTVGHQVRTPDLSLWRTQKHQFRALGHVKNAPHLRESGRPRGNRGVAGPIGGRVWRPGVRGDRPRMPYQERPQVRPSLFRSRSGVRRRRPRWRRCACGSK